MRRILISLLVLLSFSCAAQKETVSDHTAVLTILHWNDFHAQNVPWEVRADTSVPGDTARMVGGSANLLGYINRYRQGRSDEVAERAEPAAR